MEALGVFAATFVTVFALGLQSRNVNTHQYKAAALTSLMIGGSHLVLYKVLPDGDWLVALGFLCAGPLAITASMYAHDRWMMK